MTHHYSSKVARLLDREVVQDYTLEWTDLICAKKQTVETDMKSLVVFRIGLEWLALPTEVFQEAADESRLHKLPHRREGFVRGLVSVRGELLLCVSIEVLLGLENTPGNIRAKDRGNQERLLVCNRKGHRLAFFANEVHGVHRYRPAELKEIPATLAKASATYTMGILPWRDKTVGCLDADLVFYALNKGLA
jgi:chemotaxis-related protein WspD